MPWCLPCNYYNNYIVTIKWSKQTSWSLLSCDETCPRSSRPPKLPGSTSTKALSSGPGDKSAEKSLVSSFKINHLINIARTIARASLSGTGFFACSSNCSGNLFCLDCTLTRAIAPYDTRDPCDSCHVDHLECLYTVLLNNQKSQCCTHHYCLAASAIYIHLKAGQLDR